ncbi:MAG TPA: CusA/CzcA family heavy metal efflux RND transporter [Turneriella sp.]|nr:CusA/CzcA family heavy metal efflux RND transporter [Turneriella sp.]
MSFIEKSVKAAVHAPFIAILIAACMGGLGIFSLTRLNIDAYPDISGVQVQLITELSGRAAEEVEKQITIPVERGMLGIQGIEIIRSRTIFGLSLVQILFREGITDHFAREQVYQKIGELDLPDGVKPSMASLSTAYGEIFRYELVHTQKQDPMELRTLNDWVVIPRLMQIPGVVEVANFGGMGKRYAIHLDTQKLLQYGIKLQEVIEAVQANNSNGGGSILERGSTALIIRGLGRINDYHELEKIFVKNVYGTNIFVSDLGKVVVDHPPRTGVFGKDENADSVEGIVRLRRGENPSQVLKRINDAVKDINVTTLPKDIQIKPFYDRTQLIHETVMTVVENTAVGILLVIATLAIFLKDIRMALIVAVTIPMSLLFALLLMYFWNIPISLLSVGAIDFGIVVDGAVIVAENIIRRMGHRTHFSEREFGEHIYESAVEVQKPMLYSMLLVIIAYIPLLSLSSIEGLLFRPMAITLCFALLGALLFALFLVPSLTNYFYRKKSNIAEKPEGALFSRFKEFYARTLPVLIQKRKRIVVIFLSLFLVIISVIVPNLGTEFLPYLDEGNFWVRANFPEGSSLSETSEFAAEIRTLVREFQEVSFVSSQTGRSDAGNDPFPMNRIEFMVGVKPRSAWKNYKTKLDLEAAIRTKLQKRFPTLRLNITQPIIDSVTEDTNGTSANLAIDIMGGDMDTLRQIAKNTVALLRKIPGNENVNIEQEAPQPQLQIKIDKEKLARYRLSAQTVNTVVNTAIGGLPVSEIYEGERRFNILVKFRPSQMKSPRDISLLPVFNDHGEAVPLGQVAAIRVIDGETLIARAKNMRRLTVRCDIRNRSQGDFVADAQHRFKKEIQIPAGYSVEWLGMFENLARARNHFALLIPFTVVLIFLLMLAIFRSVGKAALVIMTVPFAMTGSIVAMAVRGMHFSVSAAVGMTTLFGIATMHAILMLSYIAQLEAEGRPRLEAIIEGAKLRLRPVLMTAVVAFLGLLPASLATGIGSDVQRPIATVMVWGIFSSAFLTLFLLPVFYALFFPIDIVTPEVMPVSEEIPTKAKFNGRRKVSKKLGS